MDRKHIALLIRFIEDFPEIRRIKIQADESDESVFAFENGKCVAGVGELCIGLEEVMA